MPRIRLPLQGMQAITPTAKPRISSIDVVRGLAMILMALDHVRDYFHIDAMTGDPLDPSTTNAALYITRWITHLCAPIFIFLSGTSIYLQGLRKDRMALATFVMRRGLWLIVAEVFIISLAWTFNPFYYALPLQVIWAIGISMVLLGSLLYFGATSKWLLALGAVVLLLHNALPVVEGDNGPGWFMDLLLHGHFVPYEFFPNHYFIIVYPFLPWTALMMVGYAAGSWFAPDFGLQKRRLYLLRTSGLLLVAFFVLRGLRLYGDPRPWVPGDWSAQSIFSFFNVEKYPPSLLYLCATMGIALLLLRFAENIPHKAERVITIFGRTAFFYYILHLYLIHTLRTIAFLASGKDVQSAIDSMSQIPFLFVIPGDGFPLWTVYLVWLLVVGLLYPVCRSYDRYKTQHPQKKWLRYL